MKRILVLFIAAVVILSLLALPISADEATIPDNEQNVENNESKNLFDRIGELCDNIAEQVKSGASITSILQGSIVEIDKNFTATTIKNGGFNHVGKDSKLNVIISSVYQVLYPVGFLVMLLCWGFGIAKSTISTSLDFKDKNSIVNSIISLIIGLAAMSLAPKILTSLTGVSQWLCSSIFEAAYGSEIFEHWDAGDSINILMFFTQKITPTNQFKVIVLLVVNLIYIINILWIALLQCLSPIFIGLMANQNTRKIGFNFVKEYFKAMLIPVVTTVYFFLATSLLGEATVSTVGIQGLVVSLVLAISTLGIAGKKLDKLIN